MQLLPPGKLHASISLNLPTSLHGMEARDPAHALGLQMQAYYEQYRAAGGAFPPYQPSPFQQQHLSPHQLHQQHAQQHLHYQQQHQQQQQQHQQQQQQEQQEQEQEQQQQQRQRQQHFQQQHNAIRNALNAPIIHSPASLRQMNLNSGPNPIPSPVTNLNTCSTSAASACYPPETPPHMMQHQLQVASSSPPSSLGMSISPGSAVASRFAPVFKKKRGRPRKYATEGNGAANLVLPFNSAPPKEKKGGHGLSKKLKTLTPGTTGQGFTPHVLIVGAGEDVTEKIMTFSKHGPWAVCILSANGAISNASLLHSGKSSATVTYEGRFEILSLSGLFLLAAEDGAIKSRSGGFTVSLAGQDGRVIGGRVAGFLIAATPIQVVVGTFFPETGKSQAKAKAKAGIIDGSSPSPKPDDGTQQASMPIMESRQVEARGSVQDGAAPSGAVEYEEGASDETPLQSADWGFEIEARNHSGPRL